MIRVESLSVHFGDFALRDISLEIPKGVSFVLLGPSGAGKTLLLETLLGIKRPACGRILLGGRDAGRLPPEERNISYVPQDLALFPHLSVRDNVLFGLSVRREVADQEERLWEISALLEIGPLLDRRNVRTLSGGEKQRVALARALIARPRVLFLDEPFSALDSYLVRHLQEQLRDLQRSLELTVFHVTHDLNEAFILADRIALMFGGKILQEGTPSELRERPASLEAAHFLMARNEMDGVVERVEGNTGRLSVTVGSATLVANAREGIKVGQTVRLVIRPESVLVVRPDRPLGEKVRLNLIEARILRYFEQPGKYILYVHSDELEKEIEIILSHCAFDDLDLGTRPSILIALPPSALWPIADGCT